MSDIDSDMPPDLDLDLDNVLDNVIRDDSNAGQKEASNEDNAMISTLEEDEEEPKVDKSLGLDDNKKSNN